MFRRRFPFMLLTPRMPWIMRRAMCSGDAWTVPVSACVLLLYDARAVRLQFCKLLLCKIVPPVGSCHLRSMSKWYNSDLSWCRIFATPNRACFSSPCIAFQCFWSFIGAYFWSDLVSFFCDTKMSTFSLMCICMF